MNHFVDFMGAYADKAGCIGYVENQFFESHDVSPLKIIYYYVALFVREIEDILFVSVNLDF